MRTQSPDTHPEAERVQIGIMRGFSPARKFELTCNHDNTMTAMSQGYRNGPLDLIKGLYGSDWEKRYRSYIAAHPDASVIQKPDLAAAVLSVCTVLAQRNIPYTLAGGIACGIYGLPSTTRRIEIIIDYPRRVRLTSTHTRIGDAYLDVAHLKLVELMRQPTMLRRERRLKLVDTNSSIPVIAPEDLALMYLDRFNATGRRDDALYNDLLGVLKVQGTSLDTEYLQQMVVARDLLGIALEDAGIAA